MLASMDYTVDSVGSGEEAVRFLENNRVELLILDMIMTPGMSGLETYKKILQIRPGQKAIIVSGFPKTQRSQRPFGWGAGFIHKPYTYSQLGTAVRQELQNHGAASPSQTTP